MDEETGKFLAVIALLVVFGSAFYVIADSRLQLSVPFDPDTDAYEGCGFGGEDAKGIGLFNDPATDARKEGELASTTILWFSWFNTGESRPVAIQGGLIRCGELGIGTPEGLYYRFSINNGDGWTGFVQDRNPSGSVRLLGAGPSGGIGATAWNGAAYELIIDGFEFKSCTYPEDKDQSPYYVSRDSLLCSPGSIQTINDGAVLRVEMFTFQQTQAEGEGFQRLFAKDELRFRSAIPKVSWSKNAYEVGETAQVNWQIPLEKDEKGNPLYFLTVTDMNTNAALPGLDRKPLGAKSGSVRLNVTDKLFSNDLASCQNRLRAEIFTTLIVAAQKDASIQTPEISITAGEAPEVLTITFDKAEYQEGDTIAISWSSRGNVTKFHVTVSIGGEKFFDADVEPTQKELSVRAPIAGFLQVEVTAYNRCQPSEVKTEYATIGNVFPGLCELYPDAPQCTTRNLIGLLIAGLVILASIAAGAFVFLLLGKIEQIPGIVVVLAAVGTWGAILIGAISAGYLDPLFARGI